MARPKSNGSKVGHNTQPKLLACPSMPGLRNGVDE
jgi:hypothetical protein